MRRPASGFTLVELLTVVVILGILISFFYTTFFSSWAEMDNYATRSNLWQDMNRVMDKVTVQARQAKGITVASDGRSVVLVDSFGSNFATFAFNVAGELTLTQPGSVELLTDRVDVGLSSFSKNSEALVVKMVLADMLAMRRVQIETTTEVFPRN